MRDLIVNMVIKLINSFVSDEMIKQAKDQLIQYLRDMAKRTDNELDDALVDILERTLDC